MAPQISVSAIPLSQRVGWNCHNIFFEHLSAIQFGFENKGVRTGSFEIAEGIEDGGSLITELVWSSYYSNSLVAGGTYTFLDIFMAWLPL